MYELYPKNIPLWYNVSIMSVERRPNALETVVLKEHNKTVPEKMAVRSVEYREESEIVSGEVALTTYPFLPERSVRYSDMGEMFIQSFRSTRKDKLLTVSDKLTPKDKQVLVRYTPVATLEKGIHMSDDIADNYDRRTGKESQSVTIYIKMFRELSLAFQDMSVTEEEFVAMAEKKLEEAESTGYGNARLEWKNKVFEQIVKSFQKDRKERRNRGASRMRAVHLYPITTEARINNDKTHNKYRSIAFKLNEERGRNRDSFADMLELISEANSLAGFKFMDKRDEILKFAFHHLDRHSIKFAPYSNASAKARYLLLAKEGDIEKLAKYVGIAEAEEYKDRKEFGKMGIGNQKIRIAEVGALLELALIEGDRNLSSRSDDWVWQDNN